MDDPSVAALAPNDKQMSEQVGKVHIQPRDDAKQPSSSTMQDGANTLADCEDFLSCLISEN